MNIKSEIAGKVWQVCMQPGDRVAEDDAIVILESMKMEIPVLAPAAGEIVEMLVSAEDAVAEDQVIAILKT